MNCQAVQNKILALPDPRQIPDTLRAHVVDCPGCRAWVQQAGQFAALLEQIPVPAAPAGKKDELIDELTRPAPVITRPLSRPGSTRPGAGVTILAFLRRNAAVVGGLAAAVLVVLGWWKFTGRTTPEKPAEMAGTPKHPLVEKLVRRDVALAKADTPAKRLQILGGVAEDLVAEGRALARVASADDLRDLQRCFDKVVKDGIVKQADNLVTRTPNALSPADRKTQFEALAGKLGDAAGEIERIAAEAPPEAQPVLLKIVESARDGQKKLVVLVNKGV